MFREVNVSVAVGDSITFQFDPPLSLETLLVANAAEELLWDLIAAEYEEVEITGGSFQAWPIDQAPPEVVAMLAQVQERLERELAEAGPRRLPIASVTYGRLPSGYRERSPARSLAPGEYNVLVFAEQGHGGCRFTVSES